MLKMLKFATTYIYDMVCTPEIIFLFQVWSSLILCIFFLPFWKAFIGPLEHIIPTFY